MSYGYLILQASAAAFFIVTGYRKNFRKDVRAKVIPFIAKQAHVSERVAKLVAAAELAGGVGLLVLPHLAALGLLPIMGMAYWSTIWPEVLAKNPEGDKSKLLSNALCTPEAQLIIVLLALVAG